MIDILTRNTQNFESRHLLVQRIVCEFIPNQESVGITKLNKEKKKKKK
jgi:hypothetical protein